MPLPREEVSPARSNAREVVYVKIRDWIIAGPLEPKERIRDVEVAQLLGVSRTPVREALLKLAQEGLVTVERGRSTCVAELNYENADNLYSLGAVLDGYAAEEAARRMTTVAVEFMTQRLEDMHFESDTVRLQRLDEAFHSAYYDIVGNPTMLEFLARVNTDIRRIEREAFGREFIRQEAFAEHEEILAALAAGDSSRAKSAAEWNWNRSWERIHDFVQTGRSDAESGSPAQNAGTVPRDARADVSTA